MSCFSEEPSCAELDERSCRQSEQCRVARGSDPCVPFDGYAGCIDRDALCEGGVGWYRMFDGRCLDYDSQCAPEGLEECFPECKTDTSDTGS